MSTIEINPDDENPNDKPTNSQPQKDATDLPIPFRPAGVSGVRGEFALDSGPRVPFLKIIQNVGKSSVDHPKDHGGLLYNDSVLVPRPATISFVGLQGYYIQNLQFDANRLERPKIYNTIAEIDAVGGNVTQFVKPGTDNMNFIPAALVFLVLEAPDNPKSWAKNLEFAVSYDKKLLLAACYNIRSTQYRIITPVVRTLAEAMKRDSRPLSYARYSLETRLSPVGGNFVFVPILKRLTENNPETYTNAAAALFGDS